MSTVADKLDRDQTWASSHESPSNKFCNSTWLSIPEGYKINVYFTFNKTNSFLYKYYKCTTILIYSYIGAPFNFKFKTVISIRGLKSLLLTCLTLALTTLNCWSLSWQPWRRTENHLVPDLPTYRWPRSKGCPGNCGFFRLMCDISVETFFEKCVWHSSP